MTPAEMRAKRARIVQEARAKLAEITDKTEASRAAELNAEADAMITEAEGLAERAERMERIERQERSLQDGDPRRPTGGDGEQRQADPALPTYREAFHAMLAVRGNLSDLSAEQRAALSRGQRELTEEQRAQVAGSDTAGGHLVPDEMMQPLVRAMAAWGPMYDETVATIINTSGGGSMPIPTLDDTDKTAEQNAAEGQGLTDDGGKDAVFGKLTLDDYLYDTEWLRVSIQLATSGFLNMETLLSDLLGERLGRKANAALTLGTGTGQPQGIVTGASVGKTVAGLAAITSDEILDFVHSVDPAYRRSPKTRAMFNDSTLLALHKLKDGDGNYLIRTAPDGSGRFTVGAVTVPYSINQAMPNIGASARSMVFGDFGKYFVRKIGNPVVGAMQGKEFWPGFGVAGYLRTDGVLADSKAVKALVHPAS